MSLQHSPLNITVKEKVWSVMEKQVLEGESGAEKQYLLIYFTTTSLVFNSTEDTVSFILMKCRRIRDEHLPLIIQPGMNMSPTLLTLGHLIILCHLP